MFDFDFLVGDPALALREKNTMVVTISACIGCPIGWYVMDQWLSKYAFHVSVGTGTLVLAAFICMAVSWITISYHAVKVAGSDPVKSLRYE